ncbi:sugar ABC transporter substrate-binding protein [Streptomyces sp. 110]|uniref:Sugar ABC transporter substrate-binding protein n=1 Tax=Streptomyces endocoffeicus TaxID=2898945 RepID=A0ABS1PKK8_9ACTN|nr:sugar ABC transporter substrate-binding protein [Streptomyces endocoffeicus]MBL1112938.1 sugar ABC transporter substrate-binding protein [Streptomyces endocoffeicus]
MHHPRSAVISGSLTALLATSLSACGAVDSGSAAGDSGRCKPSDVTLVQSGRGLENEYYVAVNAGARAFAASHHPRRYQWIASNGDSSKQLSQIQSILAKGGKCVVLNVDPNESSVLPAIVKAVDKSGAWLVTQWNRPDGLAPESESPHWVAHMSVDGVPQGYETAKALFRAMGGKGSIVALQGILDNAPAQERFRGLKKALKEYPGIKLLGDQTAGWDRTKAQNVTQTYLTKYGHKIGGIWAASDSMGLGALGAVKNAGRKGKVKIASIDGLAETVHDVRDPSTGYVATTPSTGAAQGGLGMSIGYAAATGRINPAKEPRGHRSFYLKPLPVITRANASSVPAPTDTTKLDFTHLWSQNGRPIK